MFKKSSSQEQLHQIGQYLEWNDQEIQFVQIKYLGSHGHALRGQFVI